jgi:hypothetical protein
MPVDYLFGFGSFNYQPVASNILTSRGSPMRLPFTYVIAVQLAQPSMNNKGFEILAATSYPSDSLGRN